jgi:hypothetical protein
MRFSQLRSCTETPTWGFIENILDARYPPYTAEKQAKMARLTGKPKPPFSRKEGSADDKGIGTWVYAAGVAVIGGIAGLWYRNRRHAQL